MNAKKIAMLVVAGILLIILLENTQVTDFYLLFWKISMSQIILTSFTLVIGFVLGYSVHIFLAHKRKVRERERSAPDAGRKAG